MKKSEQLEIKLTELKEKTVECEQEYILQKAIESFSSAMYKNNILNDVRYFETDFRSSGIANLKRGFILFKINGKEINIQIDFDLSTTYNNNKIAELIKIEVFRELTTLLPRII